MLISRKFVRVLNAVNVALAIACVMQYSAAPEASVQLTLAERLADSTDYSFYVCKESFFNQYEIVSDRACEVRHPGDERANLIIREQYGF